MILLLLLFCATVCGWFLLYVVEPGPASQAAVKTVIIPKRATLVQIAGLLGDAGIIENDLRFLLLAKLSGYGLKLQAGEFELPTGKKPLDLLRLLSCAKPLLHPVTIPEGLRATEIAKIFSSQGWCDAKRFMALVDDRKYAGTFGLSVKSLEGYLFPDTYLLTKDDRGAEKIIFLMVRRFLHVWRGLVTCAEKAPDIQRVVTLASIVEKETGRNGERPLIAGVFANRLRLGMRLQSDPTVIYGLENFDGNLTKDDLQTPSPYNTYTLPGLPEGPICSPGKAALSAVLFPQQNEFLYFVSQNDGSHYFSKNLDEHNRAVQKFQKKKSGKSGK